MMLRRAVTTVYHVRACSAAAAVLSPTTAVLDAFSGAPSGHHPRVRSLSAFAATRPLCAPKKKKKGAAAPAGETPQKAAAPTTVPVNLLKDGEDPVILEDSEYPDWSVLSSVCVPLILCWLAGLLACWLVFAPKCSS